MTEYGCKPPKSETIYYVYIVDAQRKILGVVTLVTLVVAPRPSRIRDIMTAEVISVQVSDDREVVAQQVARYDLLAIPVVDENNRLVGIVTHDDVIDVVQQAATEDAQRLGGVGLIEENYLEAAFTTIWRKRVGWLACLFGAELLTFTALARFEHAIEKVVVLSLFIPLCISTGGNSGSQAATLITLRDGVGPSHSEGLVENSLPRTIDGDGTRAESGCHWIRARHPHAARDVARPSRVVATGADARAGSDDDLPLGNDSRFDAADRFAATGF